MSRFHSIPLYLAALLPLTACDPAVDEQELELQSDDEQPDEDPGGPSDLAAKGSDPEATYAECPGWANFCFWPDVGYGGTPKYISGGDFKIVNVAADFGNSFTNGVRSMRKLAGTRRVKVFSEPNFGGSCKVVGPDGGAAYEMNLPFAVKSAKRMEPTSPGC